MPKLPDLVVTVGWEDYKFPMSLNVEGMFVVQLTDQQSDDMKRLDFGGVLLAENRAGNPVVIVDTKKQATSVMRKYLTWVNEKVITYEPFIVYAFNHKADYVKDFTSGEIFENGYEAGGFDETQNVRWVENDNSSMNKSPTFSFGVGARVWIKEISTGREGDVTEKWVHASDHVEKLGPAAEKLNSFICSISPARNGIGGPDKGSKIVPYDPDLAEFLHSSMMAVCIIADKMSEFFTDTDTTLIAAKTGGQKLLATPIGELDDA